jgi:predicted RNA binding protein YcfA (HicA-like mRNA interferase family)/predicted RNase H-like HicB family nuclease
MGKVFTSREIIKMLKKDGWVHVATVGDHFQFTHPTKPGKVTVQNPVKDLYGNVLDSIFKQAGWK